MVVGEIDQARRRSKRSGPFLDAFRLEVPELEPAEVRTLLAKFGLRADHVDRPTASLSPGERTRAALALLQASGVNLLVLDEPTNHLDLPAIEQLESALDSYDGTLLLVTHDRRMLGRRSLSTREDCRRSAPGEVGATCGQRSSGLARRAAGRGPAGFSTSRWRASATRRRRAAVPAADVARGPSASGCRALVCQLGPAVAIFEPGVPAECRRRRCRGWSR